LEELIVAGTFDSSFLSGILIDVRVEIVVMDSFWVVFTVSSILFDIEASIWDVVPSSFSFISKQDMGSVVIL